MAYTIKETTVVSGWGIDDDVSVVKIFDGHIDLNEAIGLSGDIIKITDGAHVNAKHVVEAEGLASWSGNVG